MVVASSPVVPPAADCKPVSPAANTTPTSKPEDRREHCTSPGTPDQVLDPKKSSDAVIFGKDAEGNLIGDDGFLIRCVDFFADSAAEDFTRSLKETGFAVLKRHPVKPSMDQ
jgi:hypothetical protein